MATKLPIATGLTVLVIASVHLYVLKTSRRKTERLSQHHDGLEAATVKNFADKAALSKDLCGFVARAAKEAIAMRGVFHLAVAGGTLLDSLTGLVDYKDSVDFSKVVLSFVDHPGSDLLSDEAMLALRRTKIIVDMGIRNIIVPSTSPDENGDDVNEAKLYAKAIRDAGIPHKCGYPVFDLVIMGLGPDGYMGSYYPMEPNVASSDMAAVTSIRKSGGSPSITFTIDTINSAHEVALIAMGGGKSIIRETSGSAKSPRGILSVLSKSPVFFVHEESAA